MCSRVYGQGLGFGVLILSCISQGVRFLAWLEIKAEISQYEVLEKILMSRETYMMVSQRSFVRNLGGPMKT